MVPRLLVGLLLLAVPARTAGPAAQISIAAQEEPEADAPFRAPVVFTLTPGTTGDMVWGEAGASFLEGVRRWQIQIRDFDGNKVDFIQGLGPPESTRIRWDGVTRDGRALRDAFYTVNFVWQDGTGASHSSKPIKVGLLTPPGLQDFIGPQVRLSYTADGMTIRMSEQLTFEAGRWELRSEATDALDRIADFLRRYPRHKLQILGHTDTTGTETFNRTLSLQRSQSIYRFLLERGIGEDRMSYHGIGAAQPLATNVTPEGRRLNRRVEIVLLKATI